MPTENRSAEEILYSANGAITRLYSLLMPEGDRSEDVLAFAILAHAETQAAIAKAIIETGNRD